MLKYATISAIILMASASSVLASDNNAASTTEPIFTQTQQSMPTADWGFGYKPGEWEAIADAISQIDEQPSSNEIPQSASDNQLISTDDEPISSADTLTGLFDFNQ